MEESVPGFLGLGGPDDRAETTGDIFGGMLIASGCCGLEGSGSLSSEGGNVLMSFPYPGAVRTW